MNVVRSHKEINDLFDECMGSIKNSNSKYPGMSYEEGIKNAILWLCGDTDDNPMD